MKHWSSLLLSVLLPAISVAADSPPNPGTALVTGSDRGIGFALVQEFESRGWQVIATARDPAKSTELNAFAKDHPRVSVEKLDVTDTAGIDALVNNAGVAGSFEGQQIDKLDQDEFVRVLRVNSYGPLRVSAAFLDHVAASKQKKIIGISSGYGSVASVESVASAGYPTSYFYAMSKAALNMGLREFALDAGAKRGVTTVLLSPGAVDTDMQRQIRSDVAQAGKPITVPTRTPAEVAHVLVLSIEQLTREQNGKFLSITGKEVPW